MIQQYLLQIGFQVHCEYNLDAALERLIEAHTDLLIVDGEMPEKVLGNFVEAAANVKPGVPMIAVGISEHEMQGKTLSAFVSSFIEKPFSISDISNSIKAILHTPVSKPARLQSQIGDNTTTAGRRGTK